MDGWLILGSRLDNTQLEKDINKLNVKMQKLDEKWNKKKIEVEFAGDALTDEEVELSFMNKELDKMKAKYDEINEKIKVQENLLSKISTPTENGMGVIIAPENKEQYNKILSQIDNLKLERSKNLLPEIDEITQKISEQEKIVSKQKERYDKLLSDLDGINNQYDELNIKADEFYQKQKVEQFNQINKEIGNIGKGLNNVVKKVARWGIAVFGVRSAYMFVRQAISTLSQYDEQLATDIQYIRFAIAMTLERFIKPLIEWVFKLLQYVNYLTMAWFNLNLFEKATVNAFNKSNKSAEKLKKTLAGFDEMNVLSDSGSNKNELKTPSTDLSKNMEDFKAPKWLKWIKDNGDLIKKIIIGIGIAFATWKLAKLVKNLAGITGSLGLLGEIGIIAIGVELLYTALTGRELISDIMEIQKGLKDLEKIRKDQNKQSKTSKKNTESLIKTYNEAAKSTGVTKEQTEQYVNTLLEGVKTNNSLIESMEKQKNWLGVLNGDNKKLANSQNEYNKTIDIQLEELKKLYDSGKLNNKQKAEYQILLDKQTTKLATENRNLQYNSEEWNKNREKIAKNKEELERITGKKYEVKTSIQTPNTNEFENSIKNLLRKVSSWFSNFGELKIGFGWGSGGGGFRAKGGIYYPKLAAGGIINMPGRGVPYHGATIGERGAEAVVPLTDSQQMALLGEAIGKYITVNATIVNSMNGRVLSRELQKVQNQANFATNGRWY